MVERGKGPEFSTEEPKIEVSPNFSADERSGVEEVQSPLTPIDENEASLSVSAPIPIIKSVDEPRSEQTGFSDPPAAGDPEDIQRAMTRIFEAGIEGNE